METEGALIHFGVRGASRPLFHRERGALVLAFHSALRFAVVSDPQAAENAATGRNEFQSALRFAVVSDDGTNMGAPALLVSIRFEVRGGFRHHHLPRSVAGPVRFQSALRFAVVSDPTPWHAVLTSPVAAVLHTTPPHPLQQADRTCPKWGKTPSQVAYTPEAVFGRSPTTPVRGCLQNPRLRAAGIAGFFQPYPHAASRPVLPGIGGSGRILHITV